LALGRCLPLRAAFGFVRVFALEVAFFVVFFVLGFGADDFFALIFYSPLHRIIMGTGRFFKMDVEIICWLLCAIILLFTLHKTGQIENN